jgi:hypothetical protein
MDSIYQTDIKLQVHDSYSAGALFIVFILKKMVKIKKEKRDV